MPPDRLALDARLPGSSANPMLAEMTGTRRKLKVLNKQDLADPERTREWLAHYNAQTGVRAIGLEAGERPERMRTMRSSSPAREA